MKTLFPIPLSLDKMLQKNYIDVIGRRETSVGVEIELPLVPVEGGLIDSKFIVAFTGYLREIGFTEIGSTLDGEVYAMVNKGGDICSFETTWNTLEFSMKYNTNLCVLAHRFYALFLKVQQFCMEQGYYLCGRGINPNAGKLWAQPLHTSLLLAKSQFLSLFTKHHDGEIFHAICASTQTHLDAKNQSQYIRLFGILRKAYTLEGMFFANSPCPNDSELFNSHPALVGLEKNTLCFRDELWKNCGAPNVQIRPKKIENAEELCHYLADMELFIVPDGEGFRPIPPVTLQEYYDEGGEGKDLATFRSLEPVAPTQKGSLEVRSTCTQPLDCLFEPVAFYLGLSANPDEAEELLDAIYNKHFANDSLVQVRDKLMRASNIVLRQSLRSEMIALLDVALEGLVSRQLKEEQFLIPLKYRFKKPDFKPPALTQGHDPFTEAKIQIEQMKRW